MTEDYEANEDWIEHRFNNRKISIHYEQKTPFWLIAVEYVGEVTDGEAWWFLMVNTRCGWHSHSNR